MNGLWNFKTPWYGQLVGELVHRILTGMGGWRELCEDAQVSTWEDQWHFFTMSINRPNDTTNMQEQQF